MESPTSSNSPPTESNSAQTAEVKYKEEDGLKVDTRSKQRFLMSLDPQFQDSKMGLKCAGCQMVTAHVGLVVTMYEFKDSATDEKVRISKRIIGCQNCGKISSK